MLNQQKQHTTPPESELAISVQKNLNHATTYDVAGAWDDLSIYRIPKVLLDNDEKAYIPQIVSMGPYHHGRTHLDGMERHKWRALHHILKRHYHTIKDFEGRLDQLIEPYLDVVRDVEDRARAFYEGPIKLSSDEFVRMLLLDSCFVLELFRGTLEGFPSLGYSDNDPIFAFCSTMHFIRRDMIMLENQIPLFVLERIHQIDYPKHDASAIAGLALSFFESLMPTPNIDSLMDQKGLHCLDVLRRHLVSHLPPKQVKDAGDAAQVGRLTEKWLHCLDVLRRHLVSHLPSQQVKDEQGEVKDAGDVAQARQEMIPCVTELKDAGIKFKERKFKTKERVRFWDIDFSNGIIEIPRLKVHDGTKSFFLNLMAFEHCHLRCPNYITSYVVFMDNLIESSTDVIYLKDHGIIDYWQKRDAEVAELFNQLGREVVFDPANNLMSSLSENVNTYCKQRWHTKLHKWRASLMQTYFNTPWSIISLIAAVVLLVLTFTQTLYSVSAYYAPPS